MIKDADPDDTYRSHWRRGGGRGEVAEEEGAVEWTEGVELEVFERLHVIVTWRGENAGGGAAAEGGRGGGPVGWVVEVEGWLGAQG